MTDAFADTGGVPRWKAVYDWLLADLEHYAYGSGFHTARAICERFDVSSITAARALTELANEGLIERVQGRGSVVRRVPPQASIWMLTPAGHRVGQLAFDSVRGRMIEGVREAVRQQGIDVGTICESYLPSLFPREGKPTGFLLLQPDHHEPACIDFLRTHQLPHVLVDPFGRCKGMAQARLNRRQVGYMATRYLLGLGHRRIGWITGAISQLNFRDRIKGYRDALRERGIPFKWAVVTEVDGADACDTALHHLMRLRRPPTALIMGDDSRAIHTLDACRRRGIDVPGQLSILGFPDSAESTLTTPPLTVMDGRYEQVSHAAVRLLLEQMFQGADPVRQRAVSIKPRLIERESTGPAPDASPGHREEVQRGQHGK